MRRWTLQDQLEKKGLGFSLDSILKMWVKGWESKDLEIRWVVTSWCPTERQEFKSLLSGNKPDLTHSHLQNTQPEAEPSPIWGMCQNSWVRTHCPSNVSSCSWLLAALKVMYVLFISCLILELGNFRLIILLKDALSLVVAILSFPVSCQCPTLFFSCILTLVSTSSLQQGIHSFN